MNCGIPRFKQVDANIAQLAKSADVVPLNSTCVRLTPITSKKIVTNQSSTFNGSIRWKGVSEKLWIEIVGGAPLVHRRVVFQSAATFPVQGLMPLGGAGASRGTGSASDTYGRYSVTPGDDEFVAKWLGILFNDASLNGIVTAPVRKEGISVMEDRRYLHSGKEDGAIRTKNFWNQIEAKISYTAMDDGPAFSDIVADFSGTQNVYVLDIYQFGIPRLSGPTLSVKQGTKTGKLGRRTPSDSSDEYGLMDVDYASGLGAKMARISSDMSIYWYMPQ